MSNLGFSEAMFIGPMRARDAKRRGEPGKVFDWDKAARLIIESHPQVAEAGLAGDWNYTGGCIWRDGAPVPAEDTYTYLGSAWATPQLIMDDGEPIDCWVEESKTEWDSSTYWPASALAIVNGKQG